MNTDEKARIASFDALSPEDCYHIMNAVLEKGLIEKISFVEPSRWILLAICARASEHYAKQSDALRDVTQRSRANYLSAIGNWALFNPALLALNINHIPGIEAGDAVVDSLDSTSQKYKDMVQEITPAHIKTFLENGADFLDVAKMQLAQGLLDVPNDKDHIFDKQQYMDRLNAVRDLHDLIGQHLRPKAVISTLDDSGRDINASVMQPNSRDLGRSNPWGAR